MIEHHSISIFGKGALGSALCDFFKKRSYPIRSVWDRKSVDIYSTKDQSFHTLDKPLPTEENEIGDLVFIAVPDDQIAPLSKQLANNPIEWGRRYIVHCSGNLPSDVCAPLREKGSKIAAMHPIQTFQKGDDFQRFREIYMTLEGDDEFIDQLHSMVIEMGAYPIRITAEQKRMIHIASVIASNYLISILHLSETLLKNAGINEGLNILQPLVSQTVENAFERGVAESLTGPISRGDEESVKDHLNSLKGDEHYIEIYKTLGLEALNITEKRGKLSDELVRQLKKQLNG